MEQLLMMRKIQWLRPFCSSGRSLDRDGGTTSSWFLVKSACPFIHVLQLCTDWDSQIGEENCRLEVKALIQCPENMTDCQAVQEHDKNERCVYILTESGAVYCLPLCKLLSETDTTQFEAGFSERSPLVITVDNNHAILPNTGLASYRKLLVLPTSFIRLGTVDNSWLVETYSKESMFENLNPERHTSPAYSFTIPQFSSCADEELSSENCCRYPLAYYAHTADMNFDQTSNLCSLLVEPKLFTFLFGEDLLSYKTPVVLLALQSGQIVWFPLKVAASTLTGGHPQQWQLLADVLDTPCGIHSMHLAPDGDRVPALVILGKTGRAVFLSENHRQDCPDVPGPLLCSVQMREKLLYSTGKEICCIHFDKERVKGQWAVTRWRYGGVVFMSTIPQSDTRPLLADFQLLAATYRGSVSLLTLPQSGSPTSSSQTSLSSGKDLKDLMTSIKSTSDSIASSRETLKKLHQDLQQLAIASNIAAGVSSMQESKVRGQDSNDLVKDIPFKIHISVQINCFSNKPEEKYSVVLKITNRTTTACSGWSVSVNVTPVLPQDTDVPRRQDSCTALTTPLPTLGHQEHTVLAVPAGQLPFLGYPIQVRVCMALQLTNSSPRDFKNATSKEPVKSTVPSTLQIPLPMTTLDLLDFSTPVSQTERSRVHLPTEKSFTSVISSIAKQRQCALSDPSFSNQLEDEKLEAYANFVASTLVIRCDETDLPEKELQKVVSGSSLTAHWRDNVLKMETPGGRLAQLQMIKMNDKYPVHWLLKIQASLLKLLLQLRLAIAGRIQTIYPAVVVLPLVAHGKDLTKLMDLQRQVEQLEDGYMTAGHRDALKSLLKLYGDLRQLPVGQIGKLD